MKFLNYVRSNYKRVLSTDAEYILDSTGTIPKKVVCFVYKDIFNGDIFSFWEADKRLSQPHFDYSTVLVIPFTATAEGHSWLNLLHGKPPNVFDTYVENDANKLTSADKRVETDENNGILKKLVAYSTISQIGYLTCGCGFCCYEEVLVYLIGHALNKAFLFVLVGYTVHFFSGKLSCVLCLFQIRFFENS